MGNESRFINDYHGVAEGPNAVFEEYFVRVRGMRGGMGWEGRMGVWVCGTGIQKGEEVLVSYGRGYWRARGMMEQFRGGGMGGQGEGEGNGQVVEWEGERKGG